MKRVLIVAYYFPPVSNMGSHRILRFVRHLRECDWEPIVLTGATPGWRQTDDRLLAKLSANVQVHRATGLDLTELWKNFTGIRSSTAATSTPAPLKTQGLTTWLNRWVMVPDKYFPWIRAAAKVGEKLIRDQKIDAIYSTSDPLSDHLVALRLARRTGVPWAAEFRDLWLGSPYFARTQPTALHRALHARLERRVVNTASAIVALSTGIRRYFETTYRTDKARLIYNCFEPDDYPAAFEPAGKFTVLYAGAMYSSRSPEPFLDGFGRFVRAAELTPAQVEFAWYGESPDLDVRSMVEKLGLTGYVRLAGLAGHAEVLRQMQAASVLLTLQSPADDIHVPGKLFEYIGARRPILAISKPCETADLVSGNRLGWVAEPEPAAIATRLREIHTQWQTTGPAGTQTTGAARFTVQETTRQLADVLDRVRCT